LETYNNVPINNPKAAQLSTSTVLVFNATANPCMQADSLNMGRPLASAEISLAALVGTPVEKLDYVA